MKCKIIQSGFTAVELLITLFIAAAFLTSGYQLYSLIIKDGGETRSQARASNIAYDYLQRYKSNATSPCIAQTPLTDSSVVVADLSNVTVSVVVTCPYDSATSISKILVTVKYNVPQQIVSSATYSTPTSTATPITAIAAITGTTTVGSVLTAGALTPSGATATYQWQSATTSGGTYTDIPDATASTYTLVAGDAGKYLKVVATGTGDYSGAQTSAATTVVGMVVKVLVVAGGGNGGTPSNAGGGGGASGGLCYHSNKIVDGNINVAVGEAQQNSVFGDIIALAGGAGSAGSTGNNGGSGGGGGAPSSSGTTSGGTKTQNDSGGATCFGNDGGTGNYTPSFWHCGGGGGGSGDIGTAGTNYVGGVGGSGKDYSSIFGTGVGASGWFAGGGGGSNNTGGAGKNGGGNGSNGTGGNAVANTGSGGGGGGNTSAGGSGGSGIVLVSYPTGSMAATGGTTYTFGSDTVHKFTTVGDGTFTVQ